LDLVRLEGFQFVDVEALRVLLVEEGDRVAHGFSARRVQAKSKEAPQGAISHRGVGLDFGAGGLGWISMGFQKVLRGFSEGSQRVL